MTVSGIISVGLTGTDKSVEEEKEEENLPREVDSSSAVKRIDINVFARRKAAVYSVRGLSESNLRSCYYNRSAATHTAAISIEHVRSVCVSRRLGITRQLERCIAYL